MTNPPNFHVGACAVTGKARYTSRRAAKRAARATGPGLSAYLCEHCDMFHTGHRGDRTRAEHREAVRAKAARNA